MTRLVLTKVLLTGIALGAAFAAGQYTAAPAVLADAGGKSTEGAPTPRTVRSGSLQSNSANASTRPAPPKSTVADYSPDIVRMRMEDKVVELDDRLRAEPVSPEWAARNSSEIRQALSTEQLREFNAPAPNSLEVSCRSTACRISMAFDDSSTAPDTVTALTAGIASSLPEAVVVPIVGKNGVEYHVFAAAKHGSQLFRTGRTAGETPDSCVGSACKGS